MSHPEQPSRRFVSDRAVPMFKADAARWGVDPNRMSPSPAVVAVTTPQIWVETPFEGAWTAAYRFVVRRGALVVGELRIFPGGLERDYENEPVGLWRGEAQGIEATGVPAGGLSSRLLKRLRIGAHHRQHARLLQELAARGAGDRWHPGSLVARMGVVPSAPSGPRRGRRPVISVEFLAQVAEAYAKAVERGERPVAAIVRQLEIPKARVSRVPAYVHAARNKHALLTETEAGQTSGAMTPKCHAILAALRKGRSPSARRSASSRSRGTRTSPIQKRTKPPKRRTTR